MTERADQNKPIRILGIDFAGKEKAVALGSLIGGIVCVVGSEVVRYYSDQDFEMQARAQLGQRVASQAEVDEANTTLSAWKNVIYDKAPKYEIDEIIQKSADYQVQVKEAKRLLDQEDQMKADRRPLKEAMAREAGFGLTPVFGIGKVVGFFNTLGYGAAMLAILFATPKLTYPSGHREPTASASTPRA